jgi:hypothetical protein
MFDWQNLAVALIIGLAVAYMARRAVGSRRRAGCGNCSESKRPEPAKLVQMGRRGK